MKNIVVSSISSIALCLLAPSLLLADSAVIQNSVSVSASSGKNSSDSGEVIEGEAQADIFIKTIVNDETVEFVDEHLEGEDAREFFHRSEFNSDTATATVEISVDSNKGVSQGIFEEVQQQIRELTKDIFREIDSPQQEENNPQDIAEKSKKQVKEVLDELSYQEGHMDHMPEQTEEITITPLEGVVVGAPDSEEKEKELVAKESDQPFVHLLASIIKSYVFRIFSF